jgi:tRNA(adenine34) deaminase
LYFSRRCQAIVECIETERLEKDERMELEKAEFWMREALAEAASAEAEGEVPVGAVVLMNEKIIGRGHNAPIHRHDPTAHAEIVALRQAARTSSNYRLPGTILVVTIEPCLMCVGAMIHARVEELIYGAPDPKSGAVHSCFNLSEAACFNHAIKISSGVLEEACGSMMKSFFANRR